MANVGVSGVICGRRPVREALASGGGVLRVHMSSSNRPAPILREIRTLARRGAVELVEDVDPGGLDILAGGSSHQGVVAEVSDYRYAVFDDLVKGGDSKLVLLAGVTDPANLGSIIRSAAALGFKGVLVPRRRNVGVTAAVRKVAAGAAEKVAVARVGSAAATVTRLSREGFVVIGLDERGGVPHFDADYSIPKVCLVLGGEGGGIARLVRERCDLIVSIPTTGAMTSLNVAVAAAVVMVEVTRSRGLDNH